MNRQIFSVRSGLSSPDLVVRYSQMWWVVGRIATFFVWLFDIVNRTSYPARYSIL
jgi:hypothetical protein